MACATLKRTLDWESLNQRPTKRRRCNPYGQSGTNGSTSRSLATHEVTSHTSNLQVLPSRFTAESQHSPFSDVYNLSKMSPDKMSQNIRDEIKRLHRRKQLPFTSAAIERMQDSESSGSEMGPDSPRRPDSPPSMVRHPEKALFTFKQVRIVITS